MIQHLIGHAKLLYLFKHTGAGLPSSPFVSRWLVYLASVAMAIRLSLEATGTQGDGTPTALAAIFSSVSTSALVWTIILLSLVNAFIIIIGFARRPELMAAIGIIMMVIDASCILIHVAGVGQAGHGIAALISAWGFLAAFYAYAKFPDPKKVASPPQ